MQILPRKKVAFVVMILMTGLFSFLAYPGRPAMASGVQTVAPNRVNVVIHGRSDVPKIALTFDDGPNPGYTDQILKVLHEHQVAATFFAMGNKVQMYPALVQQEHAAGHVVGNHSWDHPQLPTLTPDAQAKELSRTSAILQQTIGVEPGLMRPPYGAANLAVENVIASQNMATVLWDIDPRDWSRPGVDAIVNNVLSYAHDGAIVLMHDGGGDRSQTVAALPKIIAGLQARGFQLVTVPQMMSDMPAR